MKKKAAAKGKGSSPKSQKLQPVKKRSSVVLQMKAKRPLPPPPKPDPRFTQAVQNYEAGLKAMQEHKFDKAKAGFEKVIASGVRELADRAQVHLNSCNGQLDKSVAAFRNPDEHYDYAVSLMNNGDYEAARAHFEKTMKQAPKADYVHYGMALLECLEGKVEASLRYLADAIKMNPQNRFLARNESDFQNMADDPRFTELIYPDPAENAVATRK